MRTTISLHKLVPPYSHLSATYDKALGIPSFVGTRIAFEALIRRYEIRFRSAADIGCGTGLFACYLSRCWGVPVFAVDRSPEMLAVAARNCRSPDLHLLRQDIRSLQLPHPVDLVTANFDTLNHLLKEFDLQRALRSIYVNLQPGGHFFFDVITRCRPLGGFRGYVWCFREPGYQMVQRIHWDPPGRLLTTLIFHRWGGSCPPTVEVHVERGYSPVEVGRWLLDAGFVIRGVHDAATLRVASTCPPRIIVVARRPEGVRDSNILAC